MKLINQYKNISDLQKYTDAQRKQLCQEIREFLIDLSKEKEIHLSSNLGIVELSMALLLEFDLTKDKVIYDTGHQTYVHKLLTDRKDKMHTIRETHGLCGLMNMDESIYDHYSPGHSGNSISVMDGMYMATKDTNGSYQKGYINQKYHVVVIGDASLNNGLAQEGLNDVAANKDPLIIIVNDNEMSISQPVGNISNILASLKNSKLFSKMEQVTRNTLHINENYYRIVKLYKWFENRISSKNIFENLNFEYIYVDKGNDLKQVRTALEKAKWYSKQGPVIVHIKTVKGLGDENAKNDKLGKYHSNSLKNVITFGSVAYENLNQKMQKDPKLWILNPAMNLGSGFNQMLVDHLPHYQDTGISESHTISKASGMSLEGLKVYCLFYSTFLQRAYDQLLHDISRLNIDLTILLDRSDLSGGDGKSHHGIFDVGYLKSIPNVEIMSPRDFYQLNQLIDYTYTTNNHNLRVIRYPKAPFNHQHLIPQSKDVKPHQWEKVLINNHHCVILSYGPIINELYTKIRSSNTKIDLINAVWITKYDSMQMEELFKKYETIYVYERIYGYSGLYQDLCIYKNMYQLNNTIIPFVYDGFVGEGNNYDLDVSCHMDVDFILKTIKENN